MSGQREADRLLDVLREKACDLAVREVVTVVCAAGVDVPGSAAIHRCDLIQGDTLVGIDSQLLLPKFRPVLEIHDHFIDEGTEPLAACFESFRKLVDSFRIDDPESE
jgi:hypothetical protein